MVSLRGLMLEVLRQSNASITVLADMLMASKTCSGIYVIRSIYLFDEMGENIMLLLNHSNKDVESKQLKNEIRVVYRCASTLIEMDTMILRTMDKSKYGKLIEQLDSYMSNIQEALIQGAWELVRIYGPKDAVSIVTPGYQALSGIWKEYRKTVLPMEV